MSSNFTVVYDACVLYPAPLRSLLMYLALTDMFRARWSDLIHDEWIRNLLKKRPDLTEEKLIRTRDLMNKHIRGCLVTGFEPLITAINLPDPDDRHVVAAAIHTRAEGIITFNLKDFPEESLGPFNIKAIHPDEFIMDLMDLNIGKVIEAARNHRSSLKNPTFTADAYLDCLLKQQLPQSVSRLREFTVMI